jgi:hypothetical protein
MKDEFALKDVHKRDKNKLLGGGGGLNMTVQSIESRRKYRNNFTDFNI